MMRFFIRLHTLTRFHAKTFSFYARRLIGTERTCVIVSREIMTAENLHNWDLIVISLRTLESPRDSTCIQVRPTALLPQLAIHCSVEWRERAETFIGGMFENLGLAVERRAEEFVCLGLGSRSIRRDKNYENFGAEMFHKLSTLQPVGLCCCCLYLRLFKVAASTQFCGIGFARSQDKQ